MRCDGSIQKKDNRNGKICVKETYRVYCRRGLVEPGVVLSAYLGAVDLEDQNELAGSSFNVDVGV